MKPHRLGLAFSALFAAAVSADAQPVWKATKGDATVYLGGTIHVLRKTDYPLPAAFDAAFAASSKVYFETDLARVRSAEMQKVVLERGLFTDGTTLDKVLTASAWKNVQAYAATIGLPPAQLARMRPWFLIVMMTMVELQKAGVSMEGVDVHYYEKLAAAGKTAGELESFEDHVNFVVNLGAGHESEMLDNSVEELKELPAKLDEMIDAWKSGDLAKLNDVMLVEMRTKYPAIYQSLLLDRNTHWLPKIEALFATKETEFVLVGAAHLAGDDGLIAQLKARGCKIEKLSAVAPGK